MRIGIFICLLLFIFFSGCTTAGKRNNSQMQELQNRVTYLEAELEMKNQEISSLESYSESPRIRQVNKEDRVKQMSITQIQAALKNAGFYKGSIDGKMGPKTKEAIKTFQRANGLKADGIVGKRTLAELKQYVTK